MAEAAVTSGGGLRRNAPFTVGIVDNDVLSLRSLEQVVGERVPLAKVLWSTHDGARAVALALDGDARPDVAMVDMSMEPLSGLTVCRRIRRGADAVGLLAITSFPLNAYARDAGNAGAQGIASKNDEDDLIAGLLAVVDGGTYGGDAFESAELSHYRLSQESSLGLLSLREEQVMGLLGDGLGDEDIARELGVGRDTVRKHVQTAMRKLGAHTRWQALVRWFGDERNGRRRV